MIQLFVTLAILIVSFVTAIVAGDNVRNRDISYEKVKVTVISADKQWVSGKAGYYTYHVTVEYEGRTYELINVKSGEITKYEALANLKPELQQDNPYFDNTVYFSNGNMYSNVDGIRTDSKVFDLKMVAFGGIFIFGMLHIMCVIDVIDKKEKLRREML